MDDNNRLAVRYDPNQNLTILQDELTNNNNNENENEFIPTRRAVLRLRADAPLSSQEIERIQDLQNNNQNHNLNTRRRRLVTWDNKVKEVENQKVSKSCCVFHKKKLFGESSSSSSSSSSDSDSDFENNHHTISEKQKSNENETMECENNNCDHSHKKKRPKCTREHCYCGTRFH